MAKRTITELIDDLDGSPAEVSREIALDGVAYALDLSAANSAKLDEALAPFIEAGSRMGRGGPRLRLVRSSGAARATSLAHRERNAAVRAWAAEQGIAVSDRGRIKAEVLDAYEAAQNAPVPAKRTRARKAAAARNSAKQPDRPPSEGQPSDGLDRSQLAPGTPSSLLFRPMR